MSDTIPTSPIMASVGFNDLPIELNQSIASLLDSDKDLASFRLICKSTNDAVDADGCSFWRRRFKQVFETAHLKLTGLRKFDNQKYRAEYFMRKRVLHVIDPAFQKASSDIKPKLQFKTGFKGREMRALRVLKDLIVEAFGDKKSVDDVGYESKNMEHILEFIGKTNLLQILGEDNAEDNENSRESSLLYAIQSLLAPSLLSFDDWHFMKQTGFHGAQMVAYGTKRSHPIFEGPQHLDVNMHWLLRNIQFWRHQFLVENEPLCGAFEALEDHEHPQWWDSKLSQGVREIGSHWKGSYAYIDRSDVTNLRHGHSGQGNVKSIQDHLNGEEDPYNAFQNIDLAVVDPKHPGPWRPDFEHILQSLTLPPNTARTRAQHRSNGPIAAHDYSAKALRVEGDGTDSTEDFFIDGWLNPLPPQHGVPGWHRMTMMKYFVEEDENGNEMIDTDALWAYEGVMMPGGKIVLGRWWCPIDGTGVNMYSGPFILWNFESPEMDEDDEDGCVPNEDYNDGGDEAKCEKKEKKKKQALA